MEVVNLQKCDELMCSSCKGDDNVELEEAMITISNLHPTDDPSKLQVLTTCTVLPVDPHYKYCTILELVQGKKRRMFNRIMLNVKKWRAQNGREREKRK
jgi:hypothetical protein